MLVFAADRFRTLVFMVKDGAHMFIIGGRRCCPFFSVVLHPIHFMLAGNDDIHESLEEFEIIGAIRPLTAELADILPRKIHHIILYTFLFRVSNTAFSQSSYIYKHCAPNSYMDKFIIHSQ